MTRARRQAWWTVGASMAIGAAAFCLALLFWRQGWLQTVDLRLYDQFVKWRNRSAVDASPVVLIGITEEDIQHPRFGGWALEDEVLADLLERLAAGQPRSIGLDLYRDIPVPRSGIGRARLDAVFAAHPHIIAIEKFGDELSSGIPPPPFFAAWPERVGFNDFPADAGIDDKVRRGLLYLSKDTNYYSGLALQLALLYLSAEGVEPQPSAENPGDLQLGKRVLPRLGPNHGPYVNMDSGGYQVLLDFRGPAKFETYSLTEVLENRLPQGTLKDRIAVVGVTARSVKDYFSTPLRRVTYGIELHGHLIDQLIRQALQGDKSLKVWPEWVEAGWILLWAIAGVGVGFQIRSPWRVILLLAGGICILTGAAWIGLAMNSWIVAAPAAAAFVPGAVMSTAFQYYRERRDRMVLMQLFSKHVSPQIAREIWEHRGNFMEGHRLRPQSLTATILFTDLAGFTTVSEKMEPAFMMNWLNEYMEVMTEEILKCGGVLNEYTGDGIMAIFGIPVPRTSAGQIRDDAVQAVEAALGMGRALAELNVRWREAGKPTAEMRVGIFTGAVVTGSLGSRERLKFTVVGDSVNTASRLESFDRTVNAPESPLPHCRVLVGEPTWTLISDRFSAKEAGSFVLKGKAQKVKVFQIFGEKETT